MKLTRPSVAEGLAVIEAAVDNWRTVDIAVAVLEAWQSAIASLPSHVNPALKHDTWQHLAALRERLSDLHSGDVTLLSRTQIEVGSQIPSVRRRLEQLVDHLHGTESR